MDNVSEFECVSKKLKLSILDFDRKEPMNIKYKAILSSFEEKEDQKPLIVSMQVLNHELNSEKVLDNFRKLDFCPGIEENEVLPLLSQFGNLSFTCVMFLIEKVAKKVIYRSRDCEMLTSEKQDKLCLSCKDLLQSLEADLNYVEKEIAPEEDNMNEDQPEKIVLMDNSEKVRKDVSYFSASQKRLDLGKSTCKQCGETFNTITELGVHMSKTSCFPKQKSSGKQSSDHHCNLCIQSYRYENMLAVHCRKSHSIGYLKDCPFCDDNFEISESIDVFCKHMLLCHGSEIGTDEFKEFVNEYTVSKRLCQKCVKTFNSDTNWLFHMRRWHMEPEPSTYKTCHICGKIVKTNMINHLKTHVHEPSICPECGVSVKNKMYLTAHMKTHNKIPFNCETCGKMFVTKRNLQEHINFVHLKKQSFKCERCEKCFPTRYKVKCHIRSIHTKEKPYSCDDCDYRCSRKDGINAHRRNVHEKDMM